MLDLSAWRMGRSWACLLLCFGLWVDSVKPSWATPLAPPFSQGRLFTVTHPSGRVSHVFGTMHSDDPRVLDLPSYIRTVFAESTRFIMEIELDQNTAWAIERQKTLRSGLTLSSLVGDAAFQRALPLLAERGIDAERAQRLKPWAAALALSQPRLDGATLDAVLMKGAFRSGKPVYGLESLQEQLRPFEQLSIDEQVTLFQHALDDPERNQRLAKRFQNLYLEGDLGQLLRAARETQALPQAQRVILKKLDKRLLRERNRRMTQRLLQHFEQGGAFVAIGALHLPGTEGVLNQLERLGYDIAARSDDNHAS